MTVLKSAVGKAAFLAVVASGALVAGSASANVACNRTGECWRVSGAYNYPPGLGITFHDDAWGARHHNGYRWRNAHAGRGYYRNGIWITF